MNLFIKHNIKTYLGIIFLVGGLIFINSCTKIIQSDVGSELIYQIDGINTFDTFLEVETKTVLYTDSCRIYNYNVSDMNFLTPTSDVHVLGTINDEPLFGKTNANIYFEIQAPYYPFYFRGIKDSVKIDSVVLVLDYNSTYGDPNQIININVYAIDKFKRLNNTINYALNYPNLYDLGYTNLLSKKSTYFIKNFTDSFKSRFEVTTNQIRIPMDISIATKFLQEYDSTIQFKNDSSFRTYYPGFFMEATGGNGLLNLNLAFNSKSGLNIYYSGNTTDTSAIRDTLYTRFPVSSVTANFIKRDYSNSEVLQHLNKPNDSLVYLQANPGTIIEVKVPSLKTFSNKIINLAELVAVQAPDPNTFYTYNQMFFPPYYIFINAFDSSRNYRRTIPNDFALQSSTSATLQNYGSGYLNNDSAYSPYFSNIEAPYFTLANYNFKLTRYMQGIVSRKDSVFDLQLSAPGNDKLYYFFPHQFYNTTPYDFYIKPADVNDHANGTIRLYGGGTTNPRRMRIHVIYTNLKTY